MKLDRKRTMQKEEDNVEKQTKLIAVAVKKAIAWMLIWHLKDNHPLRKVVGDSPLLAKIGKHRSCWQVAQ
jgi:hypothetical protein